ncbi:hypothetical protein [Spartinivicinus poritis]|uniref:Uncharacterized protein n=1 Tax=Spartinivicinus poritis TaxID=2994640 RepID=A0ABT5UF63_9GAMM|nr:hypothetical protein [Spartinivicinus sp. A2-2]MDE1465025.1 hypothetical protein [Spartinivicinus sp. A2-2]
MPLTNIHKARITSESNPTPMDLNYRLDSLRLTSENSYHNSNFLTGNGARVDFFPMKKHPHQLQINFIFDSSVYSNITSYTSKSNPPIDKSVNKFVRYTVDDKGNPVPVTILIGKIFTPNIADLSHAITGFLCEAEVRGVVRDRQGDPVRLEVACTFLESNKDK